MFVDMWLELLVIEVSKWLFHMLVQCNLGSVNTLKSGQMDLLHYGVFTFHISDIFS